MTRKSGLSTNKRQDQIPFNEGLRILAQIITEKLLKIRSSVLNEPDSNELGEKDKK